MGKSIDILIEGLTQNILNTMQGTGLDISILSLVAFNIYRRLDDKKYEVINQTVLKDQAESLRKLKRIKESDKKEDNTNGGEVYNRGDSGCSMGEPEQESTGTEPGDE